MKTISSTVTKTITIKCPHMMMKTTMITTTTWYPSVPVDISSLNIEANQDMDRREYV